MKVRKSFFIRWLMSIDNQQHERVVLDIEHVQTGDRLRVGSFEEADQWMKTTPRAETLEVESRKRDLIWSDAV